ncbi:hypothetical protein GOODEAATRI_013193 [Goodea atripinnis]|uniref:Uncharacterized protein n=1 Tax=Goodea atripinnis TaxID=208336 RepID=A0ABV0PNC1_9TELE
MPVPMPNKMVWFKQEVSRQQFYIKKNESEITVSCKIFMSHFIAPQPQTKRYFIVILYNRETQTLQPLTGFLPGHSLYLFPFIFVLMLTNFPLPAKEKHPHSMILPTPS